MYLRPKLAGLFAALVTSTALFLSGCSSSQPRDINYGTDVGVGYVPPVVTPTDGAAIDGAGIDGAGIDGAGIDGAGIDGAGIDAAIDAGISSDSAIDIAVLDVEAPEVEVLDVESMGGDT